MLNVSAPPSQPSFWDFDIPFNGSVCETLDASLVELVDRRKFARNELLNPTGITMPSIILLASLVLLTIGARIFRVTAALCSAAVTFCVVYYFVRTSGRDISCDATIAGAGCVALLVGLAAGCILKAGLFFVGAAALVGAVHMAFSAFPTLHTIGSQPTLADKSVSYWILMLLSAVAGGLAVRYNDKAVLEVLSSCVGGAGIAYGLRSLNDVLDGAAPRWVFVLAGLVAAATGIVAQRRCRLRREVGGGRPRDRNREPRPVLVRGM